MKALIRFLTRDPAGQTADGGLIGLGLGAALRKQHSADQAERYLRLWAAEHDQISALRAPRRVWRPWRT